MKRSCGVLCVGLLLASAHATPDKVQHGQTNSEVKEVQSKLHEKVVRTAQAESDQKARDGETRGKLAWKNQHYNYEGSMDAAEHVGTHDWAWNAPSAKSAVPAHGVKDANDHANTAASVNEYQTKIHDKVVKAEIHDNHEQARNEEIRRKTSWKNKHYNFEGSVEAAATIKSDDWAWGGGASALQAGKTALRGQK